MADPSLEEELETDWKDKPDKAPKKHTLDSDEDDDIEESAYDIMAEDDIEGQEDGTAGFDGEVRITPFNMKEELEEGHFDTEGNYHWKKEGKVIRDSWLDNIDWVKIKETSKEVQQDAESDSDISSVAFDQVPVYRKMLEYMKPGETVAKSLRRLGGNKTVSASERWRRKKAGLPEGDAGSQQVTELTAMANQLLSETGNMDIYQESFEHIASVVEAADKKAKADSATVPKPRSYDDALDMYADDFDQKEKARLDEKKRKPDVGEESAGEPSAKRVKLKVGDGDKAVNDGKSGSGTGDGEVQWEYCVKQGDTVSGPHSSRQMLQWLQEGRFGGDIWVRRHGQGGQFYTSRRVDFELYI